MTPTTSETIEAFLLEKGDWVATDFLCSYFDCSDRRLRHLGSAYLVARPGGYIHLDHATEAELEAYCGPKHRAGVGHIKSVQALRRRWRQRRLQPPLIQPDLITP